MSHPSDLESFINTSFPLALTLARLTYLYPCMFGSCVYDPLYCCAEILYLDQLPSFHAAIANFLPCPLKVWTVLEPLVTQQPEMDGRAAGEK